MARMVLVAVQMICVAAFIGSGLVAALATSAQAQITDYQRQQLTQAMANGALQENPAIFDGTAFVESVSDRDAADYMNRYIRALNNATRTWNGLTGAAQNAPEGQQYYAWLQERLAYGQAMQQAFPAFQALKQRQAAEAAERQRQAIEARPPAPAPAQPAQPPQPAPAAPVPTPPAPPAQPSAPAASKRAQCEAFRERAMTRQTRSPMQRLIQSMGDTALSVGNVDEIETLLATARTVESTCRELSITDAIGQCPFAYEAQTDPRVWCAAAARGPEIVQAMAAAEARREVAAQGLRTPSVETFVQREGYLHVEGPTSFAAVFDPLNTMTPGARARLERIMAAAGTSLDDADYLGAQEQRLVDLRQAVEQRASEWPLPRTAGRNYSSDLARNQVQRMHDDARVIDAYLSRNEWQIIKNVLGVPLRRTLPGYVIFKRPADPFCQLRPFTLTEVFDGQGYQRAGSVQIGYVRFQTCP